MSEHDRSRRSSRHSSHHREGRRSSRSSRSSRHSKERSSGSSRRDGEHRRRDGSSSARSSHHDGSRHSSRRRDDKDRRERKRREKSGSAHKKRESSRKERDPSIRALHDAALKGDESALLSLLRKKMDVNRLCDDGTTALHQAVIGNHPSCIALMSKYETDVNVKDVDDENAPIQYAAQKGYLKCLKALIRYGADVNTQDVNGETPMAKAASGGHLEIVETLLDKGADSNTKDSEKSTPMHHAAFQGHTDIVKVLLANKGNPKAVDRDGSTPLHKAVFSNHIETAKLLLEHGVDANSQDSEGCTPLHFASFKNHVDCGKLLLEYNADPNLKDVENNVALHHACFHGYLEFVKLLLDHKAELEVQDVVGARPLDNATYNGHFECVRILLDNGVSLVYPDETPNPLHHAAFSGYSEIVSYLIEHGAPLNSRDPEGATPLHKAAFNGHQACLEILITKGADFAIQDKEGSFPLHKAAFSGNVDCLRYLLDKGAAVDSKDLDDGTPLHNAAFQGHVKCAEILIERNANVNAEDESGCTALHVAVANGKTAVAQLLLKHDAMLDSQNDKGESPIHLAVDHPDCMTLLIENGAEIDVKDFSGRTSLFRAAKAGNLESLRALMCHGANLEVQDNDGMKVTEMKDLKISPGVLLKLAEERDKMENMQKQDEIKQAVQKFNGKPKAGIEWLVEKKLISRTPEDVARFLATAPDLNKSKIGDYISERDDWNTQILKEYVKTLDMISLDFDDALRLFLGNFRLPGEAQKIDRLMEAFAMRFCECNPTIFQYEDTCYMLAFSTIMLNTDLHNPSITNRMTMAGWLSNHARLAMQEEVPEEFLKGIYEKIKSEEIKMDSEGVMFGSAVKKGFLTKQGGRYKNWKKRYFILSHNCLYYFKNKEDKEPCGIVPLENLAVREALNSRKNTFQIYDPRHFDANGKKIKEELMLKSCKKAKDSGFRQGHHDSYLIQAENAADLKDWMTAIQRNITASPISKLLNAKLDGSKGQATKSLINWKEIYGLAEMCSLCREEQFFKERFKKFSVSFEKIGSSSGYVLVKDPQLKNQIVIVYSNIWKEQKKLIQAFLLCGDPGKFKEFDVFGHFQFQTIAKKIMASVKPKLEANYRTFVAGHSLGGAIGVLLAYYLSKENIQMTKVMCFGLPKIHTRKSVETVQNLPLLRVNDYHDPVPGLFPGFYHSGSEILLLRERFFTYFRTPQETELKISTLSESWLQENLPRHDMAYYLKRLEPKMAAGGIPVAEDLDKVSYA
eukprot:TRINITY_DN10400_c0_g1_i1.p1 TRINITY_DN10400_c0_g1~~TRINITY_DN10400_c0_g1_i1.p1  ORF type:complete len:1254 (-),score=228.12 TRINITY_DN10400_c0_g1_i1:58-3819(-)